MIPRAPHDPGGASAALDTTDFAGRPVVTDDLDDTTAEAGLVP